VARAAVWRIRETVGDTRNVTYGVRRVLSTFQRIRWNMRVTLLKRPMRWRDLEDVLEVGDSGGDVVRSADTEILYVTEDVDTMTWYAGAKRPVSIEITRTDGVPLVVASAALKLRKHDDDPWVDAEDTVAFVGSRLFVNIRLEQPGTWELRFDYATDDGIEDIIIVRRKVADPV